MRYALLQGCQTLGLWTKTGTLVKFWNWKKNTNYSCWCCFVKLNFIKHESIQSICVLSCSSDFFPLLNDQIICWELLNLTLFFFLTCTSPAIKASLFMYFLNDIQHVLSAVIYIGVNVFFANSFHSFKLCIICAKCSKVLSKLQQVDTVWTYEIVSAYSWTRRKWGSQNKGPRWQNGFRSILCCLFL